MNQPALSNAPCMVAVILLLGGAVTGAAVPGAEASRALGFHVESTAVLSLPDVHFSQAKCAPGGGFLFLAPDRWAMHRLSPTGQRASFSLHAVPEAARATVQMSRGFDADPQGRVYVPGMWFGWERGSSPKAGVFIFDAGGRHLETVELPVQIAPEHVAVDAAGDFVVLAVEAAYLQGRKAECYLLHRFSRQGEHRGSFSPCPSGLLPGASAPQQRGAAHTPLRAEAERGSLWIRDGLIHHVLPATRVLRVFSGEAKPVREVKLIPPDSTGLLAQGGMRADPAGNQISRLVALPDGRFLVEWFHSEPAGASGQYRTTFLALHGPEGQPLTSAAHPPPGRPSIPLDCDGQGRVLFLHLARGGEEKVELVRASIVLQ